MRDPLSASLPPACFHCGQALPPDASWTLRVLDRPRHFCCPGCQAVCQTIVAAGLEDYYQHREGVSPRPRDEPTPPQAIYDHPAIQRSFVRPQGQWREASLLLEEIRCAACLWLNEQHLRQLPGVVEAELDYASQRLRVRWDPERVALSTILESITALGYVAHPYDPVHRQELAALQRRRSWERLIFAGAAGMMVMQLALASYWMGRPGPDGALPLWVVLGRWSGALVCAAILAYPGQEFLLGAWQDLHRRRLGMDVPIVLGLGLAYAASLLATVQQRGEVYYDSIAMLVALVLLARHFELGGRLRAAESLDRLARVVPRMAWRVGADGAATSVPVVELAPGERVRVLPGEVVPVDGRVVAGASGFDESLVSGEPLPVPRGPGEEVIGGARNIDQPVVMEVTHTSDASTVSELQRLLQRAARSRPYQAVLADRAARWLVALVLLVAGATAGVWLWLDSAAALPNAVAVLIATCPCALALATPVVLALTAGRLTQAGLLPLRMEAMEHLATADVLAFDKTGTLTMGRPRLAAVASLGSLDRSRILDLAAALERDSAHPLARALHQAQRCPSVQGRRNLPGEGVEGRVAGRLWRLGRPQFALGGAGLGAEAAQWASGMERPGAMVLALADEDGAQALLVLEDELRAGAAQAVAALDAMAPRRILVLSGDRQANAAWVASRLGIPEAHGGLTPQDKLRHIQELQRAGHRVAMVGDGINDAPTLAAADVSVSFARATDLAQSGSDFLILGEDLGALAQGRRLARESRRRIRQNLLWAAAYNLLAVPAAACGYLPPWAAALGMALSSLLVVGNSLRRSGAHPASALPPAQSAALGMSVNSATTGV